MTNYDFVPYWEQLVSATDIVDIYQQMGCQVNSKYQGKCVRCGYETLYINRVWQGFRCTNPACNDHGDVVSLIQRAQQFSFPQAFGILDGGQWTKWWTKVELERFGAVRDCMTAAAIFFANQFPVEYLKSRGIEEKIGRNYLIGANDGKTRLRNYLLGLRYSMDIIRLSGLLNRYDDDYFQQHVIIPYRQYGQVYEFVGRYVGDDPRYQETKYFRMRGADKGRLVVGRGYFNWNPKTDESICVEGEFDALSLISNGFRNTVATRGTNGLDPKWLKDTNIKRVWMCFDADTAGRKSAIKAAYACADAGVDVRVIELPEAIDPNEYFLKFSGKDFETLLRNAKTPEQWEIEHISDELDTPRKIAELKSVVARMVCKSPIERAALVKEISNKTKLPPKDIKAEVDELLKDAAEAKTIMNLDEYEQVHPALHFTKDGTTLMTAPTLFRNDSTHQVDWEPWVITSQREKFALTRAELAKRKWYCTQIVYPGKPRYSQAIIDGFVTGKVRGDLEATFRKIAETYREFVDFSDPNTFEYLAAWTVGTYFFRIFNYFPYLHFTGVKEVGKSKVMRIMSQLCFNGVLSVSITDASQFRIITDLLPSLFLDESENLGDKTYSERRAMLLGGYEKGSEALRTAKTGDDWRVRFYENFSPRAFGSIQHMDDTLLSRTVKIEMMRSFDERIKNAEAELLDPRFGALRDGLFLAAMDYGKDIKILHERVQKPAEVEFEAREWNLFKPVYTIGVATGIPEVIKALVDFANARYRDKLTTYNESALENVVLRVLLELVEAERFYPIGEVHDTLIRFVTEQGINLGAIHSDQLGLLLNRLGVAVDKTRKMVGGKRSMHYLMNPSTVQSVAKNRKVIQ